MIEYKCTSPILIIIFNRPQFVKKLINILRRVQPSRVYVVADGPREGEIGDIANCSNAINEIDKIDWKCHIEKKYSETNLGCGLNPSQGISWALDRSEEVIILEDDCMPSIDFFKYCDELLKKYRDEERIMMISGNNHTFGKFDFKSSYEFSHHTQTYGWATWRRSWCKYDLSMKKWPALDSLMWLKEKTGSNKSAKFWYRIFEMCYKKELESAWDYQWTFCCWINSGLNIIPSVNLVSNVGFNDAGTHEIDPGHIISKVPLGKIDFPLTHPQQLKSDKKLDRVIQGVVYTPPLIRRVSDKLKYLINNL